MLDDFINNLSKGWKYRRARVGIINTTKRLVRDMFRRGGSPRRWKPLSQNYRLAKIRAGQGSSIGIATGKLYRSLTRRPSIKYSRKLLSIGTLVEYGEYFDKIRSLLVRGRKAERAIEESYATDITGDRR